MTIITPAVTRSYIKGAKFPSAPPRPAKAMALTDLPPVQLKASEAQSLVVGSGLIAAAASVPVKTREDLINCTLFAQLAASGEVG
jgi:histidine ammonia-lyase